MNPYPVALGLMLAVAAAGTLHAQQPATNAGSQRQTQVIPDDDTSPYHVALVAYKAGNYPKAYDAIKGVDMAAQDDNFAILAAKIMAEQKMWTEAETLLHPRLKGANANAIQIAMGDLFLRKHSYSRAVTYYNVVLQAKPTDSDIMLKLVYAKIGTSDLVGAGETASHLTPFDPKNPYDDHAAYNFARAAIAEATGKSAEADQEIQTARTNYGNTIVDRYLKTYLQVFGPEAEKADAGAKSKVDPTGKK